jgi:hypothetical protein
MNHFFNICASILVISLAFLTQLHAQDTTSQKSAKNKWAFQIEPYIMFPNMKGNVAIGNLPEVEVDANVGDIFNNLQMGLMLYFEAHNDKWAISSDVIYMDLLQDVNEGKVINSGELGATQVAWELAGLRKVLPWLEVGVSGILNSVNSDVNLVVNNIGPGTTNKSADISKTWVEPMIVTRVKSPSDKIYIYQFKGEIGGFGIGSDLAWQAEADLGFRFSKLLQVTAGYRMISLDYETGSGEDLFVYNVDTFGPVIRLGFNF